MLVLLLVLQLSARQLFSGMIVGLQQAQTPMLNVTAAAAGGAAAVWAMSPCRVLSAGKAP
jgi:hypothetical protein